MIKKLFVIGIALLAVLTIGIRNNHNKQVQESITYFPIDPNVTFKTANTSLNILKSQKADKYIIRWRMEGTLDRKAYLRQDIGLLYANGRLIAKQGRWESDTAVLNLEKQVVARDPALYQALTFHYAELHENGNQIFSSQKMSADQIYIAHIQNDPFHSFRNVFSKQENEWKQRLDTHTQSVLQRSWEKGIRYFSINPEKYYPIPLTDLFLNTGTSFPGFSEQETNRIIGNLWEGLYKNYFLGIKKADGTKINPIGSTIPLILLAKDKSHLIVLTETANGEPTLLRQMIEYGR